MQTPDFVVDPIFETFQSNTLPKLNAEAVRIWARHFSPKGTKESIVDIPAEWMAFFTNVLMIPSYIFWAKNFLTAQVWKSFQEHSISEGMKYPSACRKQKKKETF